MRCYEIMNRYEEYLCIDSIAVTIVVITNFYYFIMNRCIRQGYFDLITPLEILFHTDYFNFILIYYKSVLHRN